MRTLIHLLRQYGGLPFLLRLGLAAFAMGGSLDLLYHGAPAAWAQTLEHYFGEDGQTAHLVTFIGMVLTLIGVVTGGARRSVRAKNEFNERGGIVWNNDKSFTGVPDDSPLSGRS